MSQYNQRYRLFFKKLTDIGGKPISSVETIVRSFDLERDALTKATSTFDVVSAPNAVENGDVVGMYDSFGTIVFLGVVSYIGDSTIEASQITDIFEDNWLWHNPKKSSIELTLIDIIKTDFQNSNDSLLNTIFGVFSLNATTTTNQYLQTQESRYVVNFANFIYDIFEKYSIMFNFDIPFGEGSPQINIGRPQYQKLLISNNGSTFRNFNVLTNVYETNKLVVYSEETGAYRESWYATTSGITNNASALNRIQKINTNIIFSDEDINILKASSLRSEIFNHEIACEMVINNNFLTINDLHLGQEADVYFNDKYYRSILTGYGLTMDENSMTDLITLRFGLVRTDLTSKLFKRLAR